MPLAFSPPVIAHRGASGYAPENTIIAFTKAAQLGVKWIECDVMQAACGKPIIFHDEFLDRTSNGAGSVNQFPYAYLKTLDVGGWFDYTFSGERIPSLQEVMEFLKNTKMSANIEIKALPGQEEALVVSILEEMHDYINTSPSSILFSSFSVETLRFLHTHAPSCLRGLLLHEWVADWQHLCTALECVSVHVNHEIMTPDAAQLVKRMGKMLLCYTVNDPARAMNLYDWGVDAVFTDVPDKILQQCHHTCE